MQYAVTRKNLFEIGLLVLLGGTTVQFGTGTPSTRPVAPSPTKGDRAIHHYLYVLVENKVYVFDMDSGHHLVKTITLPSVVKFIRGTAADVNSHTLYISYGSVTSGGSLLKYDLIKDNVIYDRMYPSGIDSFAITPDGRT